MYGVIYTNQIHSLISDMTPNEPSNYLEYKYKQCCQTWNTPEI